MTYFVSEHRDLSYEDFEEYYIPTIEDIMSYDGYPIFVVGDCEGTDKYAMDYLYKHLQYRGELHIYHISLVPRNMPTNFKTTNGHKVTPVRFIGGFKSDEEKDIAMTHNSDCDIAFIKDNRWNSGTAQNIKRRHNII